jgi:hypothetical protein
MINGKRKIPPAAELAPVSITSKNILPRENNILIGNLDVDSQPQYTRKRHITGDTVNPFSIERFKHLCLTEEQENHCLPSTDHANGLVILVQNKHFCVQASGRRIYAGYWAEDSPLIVGKLFESTIGILQKYIIPGRKSQETTKTEEDRRP